MSIEVKVPVLPESVEDATVITWHKKPGEPVKREENLVDIETDKVVLEVPAPADGVLESIVKEEGSTVLGEEVIAIFKEGEVAVAPANDSATEQAAESAESAQSQANLSPAVRRLVAENNIDVSQVKGTGKDGRIKKEDVEKFMQQGAAAPASSKPAPVAPLPTPALGERTEKRVPMSRLRARIAERLVAVQHETAMLTTFNEINMQPVMELRKKYKEQFEKKHGIKLGFMSLFTKAVVEALKRMPAVNASIDGNDVVYHGYFDIGIAVSTERGLVVPVVRDADQLSLAEIELTIADYAKKARDGKLAIEDMTGGTFTITNGGVFGSLMSTPIINSPQSGILGMHKIEERAVVENGEVVVRPMMYVALSYDHRIIDGKESVGFLVAVKEMLEDPARILLEL